MIKQTLLENNRNTAILIFTRTSLEEAGVKTLSHHEDNHSNELIARNLIAGTIRKARKTELDVHIHFSGIQKGNSFGEKLSNAIEITFNKGYENIVVIGNDCPQLSTDDISNSAQKIQQGNFVVGPDNDGGAYLIGLNKTQFNRDNFPNLDWCSSSLYNDLNDYAALFSLFQLKKYVDVDSHSDLQLLFSEKSLSIHKFLNALSSTLQKTFFNQKITLSSHFVSNSLLLRGPPAR